MHTYHRPTIIKVKLALFIQLVTTAILDRQESG